LQQGKIKAGLSEEARATMQHKNTLQQGKIKAGLSEEARAKNTLQQQVARVTAAETAAELLHQDLAELTSSVLFQTNLDEKSVLLLRNNFTTHPNLALSYYYCCSNDPRAFIANDEILQGSLNEEVEKRVSQLIGGPIGPDEASECQRSAHTISCDGNRMAACASCCRRLMDDDDHKTIFELGIAELHESFKLLPSQLQKLTSIPADMIHLHISVYEHEGVYYHLNPDLIRDVNSIVLCAKCAKNPLKYKYSLANGYDYGRRSSLPILNGTTRSAIVPGRCYNIDLNFKANHSTGHSIVFPSDGASKTSQILPWCDAKVQPQITFLGPKEQWQKEKFTYRYLYELNAKIAYEWLDVWIKLGNPMFSKITVDRSAEKCCQLENVTADIENNAIFTTSKDIVDIDQMVCIEEVNEKTFTSIAAAPLIQHSAVLPKPSLVNIHDNCAIDAMLQMIHPSYEDKTLDSCASVVAVTRSAEPFVEWTQNDILYLAAFPDLFLLGTGIGNNQIPAEQWQYFAEYYDGRFEDPMFIAVGFNQLQRMSCIRKSASVTTKEKQKLEGLGMLANSELFKRQLNHAKDHPQLKASKQLNAKICQIVSILGSPVPFSPFERAASRPKMVGLHYRYGSLAYFVTASPAEFDDLTVLRACCITDWNLPECALTQPGCTRQDLPDFVTANSGVRLRLTKGRPFLQALFFKLKIKIFLNSIVGCPQSKESRRSRDYLEQRRGAFGRVSAVNGVIEPQKEGRLHFHLELYSSVLTPVLLSYLATAKGELMTQIASYLDSIVCTTVTDEIREWYHSTIGSLKNDGCMHMPRAVDFTVPNAKTNYDGFLDVGKRKGILLGYHKHGFTCQKPPKGVYKCRVSMPRGWNEGETRPLLIALHTKEDPKKNIKASLSSHAINQETVDVLSKPMNPLNGQFCRAHTKGPVLWEMHRPEKDEYFVEQNLITTNLLECHNNSSCILGEDSGNSVQEYLLSYELKEGAALKQAVPILLAAMEHIHAYPSKADDTQTLQRTSLHLAQRTVNTFSGSHQWSMPMMALALLGEHAQITSDAFRYIFAHETVAFRDNPIVEDPESTKTKLHSLDKETKVFVDAVLASLSEISPTAKTVQSCGGTTSYRIPGTEEVILLSQVESYIHRGENFHNYNCFEYECIVEVLPKTDAKKPTNKGRPKRPGFTLGNMHPLYKTHDGFIRAKMLTPMLAGKPPPMFPGNKPQKEDHVDVTEWQHKFEYYAKYMIDLFVPWYHDVECSYSRDVFGFSKLLIDWNSKMVPFICRQRYQYLANIMATGNRSSQNELISSLWRDRNCDWWSDKKIDIISDTRNAGSQVTADNPDFEKEGKLNAPELFDLTNALVDVDHTKRLALQALSDTYESLFDNAICSNAKQKASNEMTSHRDVIFNHESSNVTMSLNEVVKSIHHMTVKNIENPVSVTMQRPIIGMGGPSSLLEEFNTEASATAIPPLHRGTLTAEQFGILDKMLNSKDQQLIFMHGGGGTGKSHLIIQIVIEAEARGKVCQCTCPTGVAATYLPHGRTFQSLFKTFSPSLSAAEAILAIKEMLGGQKLIAVVIDEVSMLCATFLYLLDARLRAIYDAAKPFGGISILLSGDFLQLEVVSGSDLWRVMYGHVGGNNATARHLFSLFKVITMTVQHRAKTCPIQQRRLEQFRSLPQTYPVGHVWTSNDIKHYKPVTQDIVDGLTHELTESDILHEPKWLTEATCLVLSNIDRCKLNATAAKLYGRVHNKLVLFWKRELVMDCPPTLYKLLYNENIRPELFAYFVEGAPGQILDNENANVNFGACNGTPCKMVSLSWDCPIQEASMRVLIQQQGENGGVVELPFPPDHIIVSIKPNEYAEWPNELNLAPSSVRANEIHLPIGKIVRPDPKRFSCHISGSVHVRYTAHAVDLAFAITVWKAQGGTFPFVLAMLENICGGKPLTFERAYVMYSRAIAASRFRCFPLSHTFKVNKLFHLRPKILAVKYRMDIGPDGYWHERVPFTDLPQKKRFCPKN